MDCPRCKSSKHVKDGIVRDKQRHKCHDCRYRYTVQRKSDVKPPETRRLALELHLEGLDFRTIGRILKISYGTVYLWVKEWGARASILRRETPLAIVEIDKMLDYVSSKQDTASCGMLLIDLDENISMLSSSHIKY